MSATGLTQDNLPPWHVLACCYVCQTAWNEEAGNRTARAWVACPDCGTHTWGIVLPRCRETTFPLPRETQGLERR